jgi:serine/threonine protein kinase
MVVMERLDGAAYKPKQETDIVQAQLSQVVKNLHDAGFVHGDLRANNICVVGDRVCLIDFDWTGRAGVCCYPGFMNHVDIGWAPGASDGLPLQVEHDLHMLGNLIR